MISAIVLAAGESKRMGQPKMLMPWGTSTVLQTVISTIKTAGISDILVVTGRAHNEVEELIKSTARIIFNESYQTTEMLGSIQTALAVEADEIEAALICLGDQPQVREESIRQVCNAFRESNSALVVPSYKMQRGHPWLIARPLWDEFLSMKSPETARDFLQKHADEIKYVEMKTSSILEDLDTPEDYMKFNL